MPRAAGAPGTLQSRVTCRRPSASRRSRCWSSSWRAAPRRMHVAARIVLEGSTVVPFHTSAGASVTMRVADRSFGPVVADRQGRVEIPIQVPPGVRAGIARAVDHNGAARETEVDLQPAPFPRVLVLAPPTLDVGSFSEIVLLARRARRRAGQSGRADAGRVCRPAPPARARARLGEARFLFEAPRLLGSGAVALTAIAAGTPRQPHRHGGRAARGRARAAGDLAQHAPAGGRQRRDRARRDVGARRLRQPDRRRPASRSPSTGGRAPSRSAPAAWGR